MSILDEIFESFIEGFRGDVGFKSEKDKKKTEIVNQMLRWAGICSTIKYKLKDKFLFSDEKKELEEKFENANTEFTYWKRRLADELNIDYHNLAHF